MAGTTPIYGFPYPESTDLVSAYPSLGQTLAEDVETTISGLGSGLTLVSPTSIANSGGSASSSGGTTTFTGVSSVSLNGVFSATYQNYLLVVSPAALSSSSAETQLRLRSAGTDNTSSNYLFQQLYSATTTTGSSSSTTTYLTLHGSGGTVSFVQALIMRPHEAAYTAYRSDGYVGAPQGLQRWGIHSVATSYDGLTLTFSAGTATGKVRVYGYQGA